MLFLLDAVGHAFVLNLYLSVVSKESDADCPAFVASLSHTLMGQGSYCK
jgi:hypothetical protein